MWLERTADLRNFLMARGGGMPAGAGADLPVYKAPPVAPVPVRGVTPGVWLKGLGSWTDRDSTNSITVLGQHFNFDTSYKQKVFGVIGGIDGGWDYRDSVFMVGLLGGYLDSNLKFNASSNSIDYTGGTVGAYATYINRGFYIDTIFKADLLKMKWNANTLAAFGGAAPETDANSYGIQADSRLPLPIRRCVLGAPGNDRLVAHQHRPDHGARPESRLRRYRQRSRQLGRPSRCGELLGRV